VSDYPILVAHEMLHQGCALSVAYKVKTAMESKTDDDALVLWLRMKGETYRSIGDMMGCSHVRVYRIVNNVLRNTVYSIIEKSVMCST
jgi:hypothetical protein